MDAISLYINGKDARITYGATLGEKGLVALMKPVPNKAYIENKATDINGKQIYVNKTYVDERDVSLQIILHASDQATMLANWKKLVTELQKGLVELRTSFEPTVYYRLYYLDCTELTTFFNKTAKFTFKFNEPNPANRGKQAIDDSMKPFEPIDPSHPVDKETFS